MNKELECLRKAEYQYNQFNKITSRKKKAKELQKFLLVVLGILGAVATMGGVFIVAGVGTLIALVIIGIILYALAIPFLKYLTDGLEEKTILEKMLTVSIRFGKIAIKIALIVAVIAAVFTTIFLILEAESGADYLQGPLLNVLLLLGGLLHFVIALAVFIALPVAIIGSIFNRKRGGSSSGYHGGGGFSSGGGFGGGSSGGGGGCCGGGGG